MNISMGGHLDIIKYLVDKHRSSPYALDRQDMTPLHLAEANRHLPVAQYLFKRVVQDSLGFLAHNLSS